MEHMNEWAMFEFVLPFFGRTSMPLQHLQREAAMTRRIIFLLSAILFSFMIPAESVQAGEPPSEPILRIESGMHNSVINRIGLDAEQRYLITGSADKTIGVWDAKTGTRLQTLRVPVGSGNEGKIYAAAISPDGATVVAGGWTQFNNGSLDSASDKHTIYVFDRSSGRLLRGIKDLPDTIRHLAFSHDGRYLVACLSGTNGIRLYRTSDYRLVGEDKDYGDDSHGADFDRQGRLATTSFDGLIRLYRVEQNGTLLCLAKEAGQGGKKPSGVSFSPDMAQLAVGYQDVPNVEVLSAINLSHINSPNTRDLQNGNLASVCWSTDGSSLYAGGYFYRYLNFRLQKPIFKWTRPDRWFSSRYELQAADMTITHILPLKTGGIVFSASDPAIGFIDGDGRRKLFITSQNAEYFQCGGAFQISFDALTVQFAYEQGGSSRATFSVAERRLDSGKWNAKLEPAITHNEGLQVTDWRYHLRPKLNGKPLRLPNNEKSVSLAISPSGESFLLGSELTLRLFDKDGSELWRIPAPGVLREVNVSGNGKVAVAAFLDGTIRWYQMTNGRELLAFFPHRDRKRWVLWTPEGFFDASPGGAELIGYHLNRGKDRAADFIPVEKLYDTYYRPDLITAKLHGRDISVYAQNIKVERLLNAKTVAPKVKMLTASGDSNKRDMTLKAQICDVGGGIGDITLYLNDMPVSIVAGDRGVKVTDRSASEEDQCHSFEQLITLQNDRNVISLMAYNRDNTIESDRDAIAIVYKQTQAVRPDLHILTIAIDKYRDGDLRLKYSINDAVEMEKLLGGTSKSLFHTVHTHRLYDEDVTKEKLDAMFADIGRKTKREDVFILFVAGHGITNEKDGAYYYLPVNFRYTGDDAIATQGVSMTDFKKYLAKIQAMKSLLLLDTCNSGSFVEAIASRGVLEKTAINKLTRAVGRATIVASSKNQVALEGYEGHGVFTYTLLEALKGKAADKEGKITINGVATYVEELLPQLTYKKWGYEQIPQKTLHGMDFPIAVMK